MSDFEVTGADQFLRLSKALKHAGRTQLRKELNAGMRKAAKSLIPKTRAAALDGRLPDAGGLAQRIAKAPQRVQVRTGKDPGVSIVAGKAGSGARAADVGFIRHPVFGRDQFVTQAVEPGWFSKTLQDAAPDVVPDLERALADVADRVVREAS